MRVETYGDRQVEVKETKAPPRLVCHICHGMAVKERPNGDVFDCPNVKCDNGYILIKNDGGKK